MQEKHQERTGQKVEHWNLIFTVSVFCSGRNTYAIIDGERHKVYPTGNEHEPWTTNISYRKGE